jgi:lysozyme
MTERDGLNIMREPNQATIDLIKIFEGVRLDVYLDAVRKPTVGIGHLIQPHDGLKVGDTITQEQADTFLAHDLAHACDGVERVVTVPLNDNQFGALVSFTFNLGIGNLESSTLLRKLNVGDYDGAANEMLRWNRAGGHVLTGLTRRRQAERDLFLTEAE